MTTPVYIDFESQSALNLREVGGRVYAKHDSTKIICLCAKVDAISYAWVPTETCGSLPRFTNTGVEVQRGIHCPAPITYALSNGRPVCAHNWSHFDRFLWDRFIGIPVRWVDTQQLARAAGLPGALDKLGTIFRGQGKDRPGAAMLKKMYTLTWDDKKNAWVNKWTLPGGVMKVVEYCLDDVEAMERVYDVLHTHPFYDPDIVEKDREINDRGIGFDEGLAAKIAAVSAQIVCDAGRDIEEITGGEVKAKDLKRRDFILKWLEGNGVKLKNMRRETIDTFLEDPGSFVRTDDGDDEALGINPVVTKVLSLRNAAMRITGAKLERASAVCIGGRIYDLFNYCGAFPGRWTSRVVQVHNLPRGVEGLDVPLLCDDMSYGSVRKEAERLGEIQSHPVSADDVLSSMIRPCFRAKDDYAFAIGDFSQVEARCLAWLAGDTEYLNLFRRNEPLYEGTAAQMFGVSVTEVTKTQRQAGKVAVLACIAQGSKVLTRRGYVPIEELAASAEVWDGYQWVKHGGVVPRGVKTCIKRCGVWMTPDHKILTTPYDPNIYTEVWVEAKDLTDQSPVPVLHHGEEDLYPTTRWDNSDETIEVETYDIMNCGPRNRFLVKEIVVHNCGFGCGKDRLGDFASNLGIDLEAMGLTAETIVEAWRTAHPKITGEIDGEYEGRPIRRGGLWKDLEEGFKTACEGGSTRVGKVRFQKHGQSVLLVLPSGRSLCYRKARVEERMDKFGRSRPTCLYESPKGLVKTWGGTLAQNLTEAVCRDILACTMRKYDDVVLHVHDELVREVPMSTVTECLYDLILSMSTPPQWAEDFPMSADGHTAPRYTKSRWLDWSVA